MKLVYYVLYVASFTFVGESPLHTSGGGVVVSAVESQSEVAITVRKEPQRSQTTVGVTAYIEVEPRPIRLVGDDWRFAAWGCTGITHGRRVDMTGGPTVMIDGTFPISTVERTYSLAWATCDVADMDGDGVVGGADLAEVLNKWGRNSGPPWDVQKHGTVDGGDIAVILNRWGTP